MGVFIIVAIIGYIIVFFIAVFITRAIFSIPKFLKLQEAQLQIITELAKQQGVKSEVIKSIYDNCGVPARVETNTETKQE